jgi:hypothetical protein
LSDQLRQTSKNFTFVVNAKQVFLLLGLFFLVGSLEGGQLAIDFVLEFPDVSVLLSDRVETLVEDIYCFAA